MRRASTVIVVVAALIAVAATGLLTAGCGSSVPDDAVATVGDTSVTKADFKTLMTQAKTQIEAQGTTFPSKGSSTWNQYAAQIVEYLVQEQIVDQSAKSLGIEVTDSEVNKQVKSLIKAYGGKKTVLALLEQQGMTMDLLKRSIRNQLLASRAAAVVAKDATVTDAEIEAYWKEHKAEYKKSKSTRTLAKAKSTIKETLLTTKQEKLWTQWINKRTDQLGVEYAEGYNPTELEAAASASASASPSASATASD